MTASSLTSLARHDPGPGGQVVSVYVDCGGRVRPRRDDVDHAVGGLLHQARQQVEQAPEEDQAPARAAIAHLATALAAERDRSHARGLAAFADQDGVISVVSSPQPFEDAVSVGLVPDLGQLVAGQNRTRRFLVALVDSARARLLDVVDGEVTDEHDLASPRPRAVDRERGGRAGGFDAAADAVAARHLQQVSETIGELLERDPCDRLVLGGVSDVVAALANRLPAEACHALVPARLHVAVVVAPTGLLAALQPVVDELERARLQALLDDAHAAVGQGRAALGLGAALRTLDDRRTELLLLGKGYRYPGLVCRACGALWAHELDCAHCGAPTRPVADVVAHVIVAALRQHADVEIVPADAIDWVDPVVTVARF
jgi:hypothetical protein